MRVAFLTMVWRDHWLLEKWVAHNSRMVPRRQLYVVNHGGDAEVDRIAEGCNVIHVPRDEVPIDLTRRRWDLLGATANGLLAFHDRVVCTDVDELLVHAGPERDLIGHLARTDPAEAAALAPVGLNLIPTPEDAGDSALPVLARHPNAMVSAKYTKPCIAARRVVYTVGGHGLVRGKFRIDPQVLLFHLHYVTPDYAERMEARRRIVAEAQAANGAAGDPVKVPLRHWVNWSQSEMIREKEFGFFAKARPVDVSAGFRECAEILNAGVVRSDRKMVVEPAVVTRNPARIVVPEQLRDAI